MKFTSSHRTDGFKAMIWQMAGSKSTPDSTAIVTFSGMEWHNKNVRPALL